MVEQVKKNKALDIYPLSPLQEGMLFHHLYSDGSNDHVTQGVLPVEGDIDVSLLNNAFQMLIDRHDALRTVFIHEDVKKPRQVVVANRKAKVRYFDLTNTSAQEWTNDLADRDELVTSAKCSHEPIEAIVSLIADNDQYKRFDLKRDLLVRITLIKVNPSDYRLIITNHHIILDGWSLGILLEELIECYWAEKSGDQAQLKPVIQFKHYIKWVIASDLNAGYGFFEKMLDGFGNPTGFPRKDWYHTHDKKSKSYPNNQSYSSDVVASFDYNFGESTTTELESLCRKHQITINSAIQGLWALALKCFSNTDDVVFGNVVSGRSPEIRGVEKIVGMTINTLPLRVRVNDDIGFFAMARAIQNNSKTVEKHSYLQLANIQNRTRNNQALFDHIIAFENYPITKELFVGKYANIGFVMPGKSGRDLTSYDLSVTFLPGKALALNIVYHTKKYSKETISAISDTLNHLITQLICFPNSKCGELNWVKENLQKKATEIHLSGNDTLDKAFSLAVKNSEYRAITSILDEQGRKLPTGALGALHANKTDGENKPLPFIAIMQSSEDALLVANQQRRITHNNFYVFPETIENSVLTNSDVSQCALIATNVENKEQTTLYIIAKNDSDRLELVADIKQMLATKFPYYMHPTKYQFASIISETEEGITVEPDNTVVLTQAANTADRNDAIEEKMALIWKEVLGVDSVEQDDDFFLKGGHSLLVIRFISRAKKILSRSPTTADIFSIRTFSGLVEKVRISETDVTAIDNVSYTSIPINKAVDKSYYQASSQQQRLYSLQALDPESLAYNMPDAFLLKGPVDVDRLSNAFKLTMQKHEALRTSFHLENNIVVQKIHQHADFELTVQRTDIECCTEILMKEFVHPFSLDEPSLVRASLFLQGNEQGILMLDMHHIVTDGISIDILVRDLVTGYGDQVLTPANLQYKDYCEWLRSSSVQKILEEQKNYWLNQFGGDIPVLALPIDFKRKSEFRYGVDQYQFDIGIVRSKKINDFCQAQKVTPYMFFMAVYYVLLSRHANQTDIVVGMPIAGRNHPDSEDIVGMFVNTLAIKQSIDFNQSFSDFLAVVKENILGALNNQNFSLEELISSLNPPRDLSRNALFDVLFVMEDKKQPIPTFGDVTLELVEHKSLSAKCDLLVAILDDTDNYSVFIEFADELFLTNSIKRMAGHFSRIIDTVLLNSTNELGNIEILGESEITQLTYEFNDTASAIDDFSNITEAFEAVVEKNGNSHAVVFNGSVLTYSELNAMVNRMAFWLRSNRVGKGDIVALVMTKSLDMIVAIYSILKSGAAYVPVGVDYPKERILSILDELKTPLVIFSDDVTEAIQHHELDYPCVSYGKIQHDIEKYDTGFSENVINDSGVQNSDLAYVIYTSGSTGKPKGIMIEQRSILNLARYFKAIFGPGDNVTQFAPFTFDASAGEILTTLLNGACLHVLDQETIEDPTKYARYLSEKHITFSALPPPYLVNVDFSQANNLHTLLAAGSSSNADVITTLKDQLTYINAYGPTETTVISTEWRSDTSPLQKNCIGKPILNTTVYILNSHGKLQPVGVEGEICIGGMGVARGYVNDPTKTASLFISNPYRVGETIYRTGDIGKLTENGEIVFLGRKDDQVKIRGFRIEIAEVEHHINSSTLVDDAHVLAFEDKSGNLALCCYFTSSVLTVEKYDAEIFRHDLRKRMPEYMIPAYLVIVDNIPLTTNGKVDRKQLPPPEQSVGTRTIELPRNVTESILIDAWKQVIGNDNIGITDNFFSLGGDSIKAIQIAARMNSQGFKLDVGNIFKCPRIHDLSAYVKKSEIIIEQGWVSGIQRLTPIQHWFFKKSFTESNHWNQSTVLYKKNGFDLHKVRFTLTQLLEHHDNLRAIPDETSMYVSNTVSFNNDILVQATNSNDIAYEVSQLGNAVHSSIQFNNAPLLGVGILTTESADFLIIVIHHLLVDGISWRILYDDFCTLYRAADDEAECKLPVKTHSFKQWSEGLYTYSKSNALQQQYSYWRTVCDPKNLLSVTETFGATTQFRIVDTRQISIQFTESLTRDFIEKSHSSFNTNANDILLTALSRAIASVFGVGDYLINLEGHGREAVCEGIDVSRTVGWFTTAFPVRLHANNAEPIDYSIVSTKETLRSIPDNGIGYGVIRFLRTANENDIYESEPEISFNFLGEFSFDDTQSEIEISEFEAGSNMSPKSETLCALNINGSVFQNRLNFDFEYLPPVIGDSNTQALVDAFKFYVGEIVNYCCDRKDTIYTPSDFSAKNLTAEDLNAISERFSWEEIEAIHNLTPLQEGMLYTCILNEGRGDYNIQNDIVIRGQLNQQFINSAFKLLAARHQALRTAIIHSNLSRPRQIILKDRDMPFSYLDITDMDAGAQNDYIKDLQDEDWRRGFDLTNDSLTRILLLKITENEHRMLIMSHHIMMDGWCIGAIFGELLEIYNCYEEGIDVQLDPAPEYADYLEWLDKRDKVESIRFWQQTLNDFKSNDSIPFISNANPSEYRLCEETLVLDKSKTEQLSHVAAGNGLTLNSITQAVWSLLLASYTNSNDVMFANVISGRPAELTNADKTIGLFVNTIPLRVKLDKNSSFRCLAEKIQTHFKECEANGFVGLSEIREVSAIPATIFDHVFVFENFPVGQFESDSPAANLDIEAQSGKEQVNYNFNIILVPGDEFSIRFSFNEIDISYDDVRRIKSHFSEIIDQVLVNIDQSCSRLSLLNEIDAEAWSELNATQIDYNLNTTLVDLIYSQAKATPDNTAVVYGDVRLSYSDLWLRAGCIAAHLIDYCGVSKGAVVALVLKRSHHMITGLLGILRAGCAYLPIDPDLPIDRVNYMLENSDASVIVTDVVSSLPQALNTKRNQIVELGSINKSLFNDAQQQLAPSTASGIELPLPSNDDLAYVLYTSGSTGKPKGVMIEHHSIVNRLLWMIDEFNFSMADVFIQKTAFTFDVSVFELIAPFMCGASLVFLEPGEEKDPSSIVNTINREGVSVIHFVPSMLSGFLHAFEGIIAADSLRLCVCSGETLTDTHKNRFYEQLPDTLLSNLYGPTEAAIDVTYQKIDKHSHSKVSIGRPVANTRCYILDPLDRVVPVGIQGELCLAGVQLARGYINNDDLTKERFVTNSVLDERLYRTGDIAQLGMDGNIHYIGRSDFQIKIRGYRVEIGEIENGFTTQTEVKDVLVTANELNDGTNALCAYYTLQKEITVESLKERLAAIVPDYMIPTFFIGLSEFPLNTSGKVDRSKLPNPIESISKSVDAAVAPTTEMERIVESIWRQVLLSNDSCQQEFLPVDKDFEQLGGHSISAIRVCSLLSRDLNIPLPVANLYRFSNIRSLAGHLENINHLKTNDLADDTMCAESFDSAEINNYVSDAMRQWADYEKRTTDVSDGRNLKRYAFSPVQSLHMQQDDRLSGGMVEFKYCHKTDLLMQAIHTFILEQELLVSTYIREQSVRKWMWLTPNSPQISGIPLLDLSCVTLSGAQVVVNKLTDKVCVELDRRFHKRESQFLPYMLFLVKIRNGGHQLLFGADHIITDASTLQIIQSKVTGIYLSLTGNAQVKENRSPALCYEEYVNTVRSGPCVEPDTYLSVLCSFIEIQNKWLKYYNIHNTDKMHRVQFERRFNSETTAAVEVALDIFIDVVKRLLNFPIIPVTLVVDQRKHLHSGFYEVVGEFLDHVPLLCDTSSSARQWLNDGQEFIALAGKDNVNFLALVENEDTPDSWKNVSKALYKDEAHLKLIRFNYQGEEEGKFDYPAPVLDVSANVQTLKGLLCDVTSSGDWLRFSIETNIPISSELFESLNVEKEVN